MISLARKSANNAARWFLVLALSVLATGFLQATNLKPAFAYADGYPWSGATYVDANYDWGYSTCPANDTGCMSLYGYLNGVKYGEADPWVYYLRNCTSYAAWKINNVTGATNISGWGNAASWDANATGPGHPYTNDSSPQVGDIAQWGTEAGGGYGHVAYVYAVNSGVASLAEYNVAGTGVFTDNRTTTSGSAGTPDHYIHISGDTTPPSTPPNLTSSVQYSIQALLNWGTSTDNVGVTGYVISRANWDGSNAVTLATVSASTHSYADVPPSLDVTYTYTVKAKDAAGNLSAPATTQIAVPDLQRNTIRADFNGDGKDDVLVAHISGTDAVNYWVSTSTGSGLNAPVLWSSQPTFSWSNERIVAADIDGDGKSDLVVMHKSGTDGVNLWWFRSTGTSFADPVLLGSPTGLTAGFSYNYSKLTAADYNGDGKDDVAIAHLSGTDAVNYWVFTSTGSGLNAPVKWSYQSTFSWNNEQVVSADIDGDGKRDLIVMHRTGTDGVNLWWFQSTGTSFASPVLVLSPAFSYDSSKITAADFNGDGKGDVAIAHISGTDAVNYWVFTSTGSGLNAPVKWSYQANFSWSNERIVPADIDGDGKSDLIVMHKSGTDGVNLWWFQSTGTSFASPVLVLSPSFSYGSSKLV